MNCVANILNETNKINIVFGDDLESIFKKVCSALKSVTPTMRIKSIAKIKSWKLFLKNDGSKQSCFSHVAKHAKSTVLEPLQQTVVTCWNQVLTNPTSSTIKEYLSPCDSEEAYTRIILYAQ